MCVCVCVCVCVYTHTHTYIYKVVSKLADSCQVQKHDAEYVYIYSTAHKYLN